MSDDNEQRALLERIFAAIDVNMLRFIEGIGANSRYKTQGRSSVAAQAVLRRSITNIGAFFAYVWPGASTSAIESYMTQAMTHLDRLTDAVMKEPVQNRFAFIFTSLLHLETARARIIDSDDRFRAHLAPVFVLMQSVFEILFERSALSQFYPDNEAVRRYIVDECSSSFALSVCTLALTALIGDHGSSSTATTLAFGSFQRAKALLAPMWRRSLLGTDLKAKAAALENTVTE